MVFRQRTTVGVGREQGVTKIVVLRPLLQLPEGYGEVVEIEAPAAVVEIDRAHRTWWNRKFS